jgi:2-oxoglutarate ferredoxin oxidoreductase subunit alpha
MNAGQMVEDVRLAVEGRCPVEFYGRMGGPIPLPDEILPELEGLDAGLPARPKTGSSGDEEE